MSEYRNDIDDLFYEGIEAHHELPSTNVWKEVETELNKQDVTVYKKKYGKLKKSFALLLLLFMGFLVYDILNTYVFEGEGIAIKKDTSSPTQDQGQNNSSAERKTIQTATTSANKTQVANNNDNERSIVSQSSNDQEKIQASSTPGLSIKKDILKEDDVKEKGTTTVATKNIVADDVVTITKEADKQENNSREEVVLTSKNKNDVSEATQPADNEKSINEELVKAQEDDLLLTPYTNTYISQLRSQSPGLFTMPLITENSKKNLLNGLWPAAENLTEPSLLYTPEPFVLNNPSSLKQPRFFLSANYTPYTSFNTFTDNRTNRFNNSNSASTGAGSSGGSTGGNTGMSGARRNQNFNFIRESESNTMAYSAGLKAGYWLDNNFYIETGLNYITATTSINSKYIYARDNAGSIGFDLHTTMGSAFLFPTRGISITPNAGDSMWLSDSRNTARYLGIPFTLGYKLASSKWFSLETFAGGQYNILLRGSTWGILNKGTATESYVSSEMKSLRPSYFSLLAGFNAEMRLNRHFSFVLSPTGQFGLSYMNQLQGTLVRTRSNYLGLSGGMRVRF